MGFSRLNQDEKWRVLTQSAGQHVEMIVTLRVGNRWVSLRSMLLGLDEGNLWLTPPIDQETGKPYPLPEGEKVGGAFRIEPLKYSFVTHVGAEGSYRSAPAVSMPVPVALNVTERRMCPRASVPEGQARASFWPGGRDAEPDGLSPDRPMWSGRVLDISFSGCQVCTSADAARFLEPGDVVGIRLVFGKDAEPVYVNAQFRHAIIGQGTGNMGFQFAGMEQSLEGMAAMEAVVAKVEEFLHK